MKENAFYFPHDFNARTDIKIKKLLFKLGYEGYGIFWALVEDLYNNANALPTHYDILAFELRTQSDKVQSVVNDFDLFVVKDGYFSSNSIENRLNDRKEKSVKASMSAKKRWQDANVMRTHSESNAIKERKGKEKKEKEIDINKEISSFKQFPVHTDLNPLPEFMVNSIKLQIINLKHVELSDEKILSLWHAFIVENINGSKFYQTESEIHKHFSNWLKKQNINATNNGHTKTRQQTTNESIEYIKQKGNELFNRINKSEI